jgi:hypothetical protein
VEVRVMSTTKPPKKNPHAVALGRAGAKAKWAAMSAAERSEHNRAVAKKRWARRKEGCER